MMKAPASIQSRAGGNTMFTLFQGDTAFQNIPSVGGLAGHPTAAFHVNHKGVLYINKPLYDILQRDGRPLEMGVDIGGTVREWSRPLIPLTVILAALWLLGLLLPAGSDIQNLTRTSRLPALDSLRGVAAVVVLLHHAIFTFYPPQWFSITFQDGVLERAPLVMEWIKFSPIKLLFNGQLMVIIFWILSGLVLSMPILAKESYPKIAQAAAKRYFRLMPVAAFTVMATYFLLVTDSFWHGAFSAESGYMVPSMVRNFPGEPELVMALKDAFGFGTAFNSPLWTISLEFQGSLILFAVIACTMSLRHRRLVWLAVMLYLIFIIRNYYFADFILGLFLADYVVRRKNEGKTPMPLSGGWTCVLLVMGIIIGSAHPGWANLWLKASSTHFIGAHTHLTALCFVCLATLSAPVVRALSVRPLVWIGERSFALYAVHVMLVYLVGHAVATCFMRMGISPEWSSVWGILAYVAVAFGVADLLTRFVDWPSIVLAQKIAALLQGERAKFSKPALCSRYQQEELPLQSSIAS